MKRRGKFFRQQVALFFAAVMIGVAALSYSAARAGGITFLRSGFAGDNTADGVLGQANFVENTQNFRDGRGVETSFASPPEAGVAIDTSVSPNRVFVVDGGNNRVLGWNNINAFASHAAATIVIGQPSFYSGNCNLGGTIPTASTLCGPSGVAVDGSGRLYVADRGNNRVLEYDAPFTTDRVADDVFGQFGSFVTSDCNQNSGPSSDSLCAPTGVAADKAGNLLITDRDNNRTLLFFTPEALTATVGSGDTSADKVFGQAGSFSSSTCNISGINQGGLCKPTGVAWDGAGNVYIADTNNSRVLEYKTPLTGDTVADLVFGQLNSFATNTCDLGGSTVHAGSLCNPTAVATDSAGNLYIADTGNSRVIEYNTPITSGTNGDKVIGQPAFNTKLCNGGATNPTASSLCSPTGVSVDTSDDLYVADGGNNRELSYTTPLTTDVVADGVLSQVLLTTGTANEIDASGIDTGFNYGSVAFDKTVSPNRVYVADYGNNRVLAWNNVSAFTTHAPANLVIGQPNAYVGAPNAGGAGPTANSLFNPIAVAVDSVGNLYVADSGNNRVLEYNTPFSSGGTADKVFGQLGSFTSNICSNGGVTASSLCDPQGVAVDSSGNVYIGDNSNNRVLEYNTPLTTDTVADRAFGQATFTAAQCNRGGSPSQVTLCTPWGLAVDGANNLYVADNGNNRVLEYFTPIASGTSADRVFGQNNSFATNLANPSGVSAKSLDAPQNVAVDGLGNVYVVDKSNNRGLKFNTPGDTVADQVFGQGGVFTNGSCDFTPSPNTLCVPDGVGVDGSNNVYIVDGENHRVLQYLTP